MIRELNSNTFDEFVNSADRPVVLQVWAAWCAPCSYFKPIIDEIAEENSESIIVARLNLETEPKLAQRLNIMDIPTVIVFNEGRQVKLIVGAHDKNKMLKYLKKYI